MAYIDEISDWAGELTKEHLNPKAEAESLTWSARKRIYLEGKTDYDIIAVRWFHSDSEIEFKASENNNGGCQWVLKQVEDQEDSYGIVDRDCLLATDHYTLFYQTDDEEFSKNHPFGERVLVLSRYEIENLLLNVSGLFKVLNNRQRTLYKKEIDVNSENKLCELLLYEAKRNCLIETIGLVFRIFRERQPGTVDGLYYDNQPPDDIKKHVEDLYENWLQKQNDHELTNIDKNFLDCLMKCYRDAEKCYNKFIIEGSAEKEKCLLSIAKIIDGKKIFDQIKRFFNVWDPFIFDLAEFIARKGMIPAELSTFIEYVRTEA